MSSFFNKSASLNILGMLLKQPDILDKVEKYQINKFDFHNELHEIIFISINNLYLNGMKKIEIVDIANYLKETYPKKFEFFENNNGKNLIEQALKISDINKLDYYYDILKKMSILRTFDEYGIDVKFMYNPDETDFTKISAQEQWLQNTDIEEITNTIQRKIDKAMSQCKVIGDEMAVSGGANIFETLSELEETPAIGLPVPFSIYNTVVMGARRRKVYVTSGFQGLGKAIPNYTIIPTPNGDKRVDEIKVGDYLFDRKGKPTKVLAIHPQREKKQVYQITFKDGRKVECCNEHLWTYYYESHNCRKLRTESLKDMLKRYNGKVKRDRGGYYFKLPLNEPAQYEKKNYTIPPYVMGLLLGDGSFRYNKSNRGLTFSSVDEKLPKKIAEMMNYEYVKNSEFNYTYSFNYKDNIEITHKKVWVEEILKDFPKLWNVTSEDKYIPNIYLEGDVEQRFDLLAGLLDTDGSVDEKGRISFTNTSERLITGIIKLCNSLGMSANYIVDKRSHKYTRGKCYTVLIHAKPEIKSKMFKLDYKIKKVYNYLNNGKVKKTQDFVSIVDISATDRYEDMTCFTVDNEESLFLMNDYIVTHNTRSMIGECVYLSASKIYNNYKNEWEELVSQVPTLFVATEQDLQEIQTMILAFISGVNEERILNPRLYEDGERERVMEAANVFRDAPIYIKCIEDFSITEIENIIKINVEEYNVYGVFFDYIHSSLKLLEEISQRTKGMNMREDQALFILSNKLKNIANTYDVFVRTGTQVNRSGNNTNENASSNMLRGASSIADKIDLGEILMPLNDNDKTMLDSLTKAFSAQNPYNLKPNMIRAIYKNRRGRYKDVKVWCHADLGTCRYYPLFVTTNDYELLNVMEYDIDVEKIR